MIPTLTKTFVIVSVTDKILGCSSSATILLKDGCFLVFKILISFEEREKNATSLPARKKESSNSKITMNKRMVVAPGVIASKIFSGSMEPATE